ncbi:MAG: ATP-binding cassette domain-containing protein, partial [Hyphomicrobiales bacterium]
MKISRIHISGLFERADIDIPIKDNKLILVGANGLGKSTVLNIIYSFLSRRWDQLAKHQFESIQVEIDKAIVRIDRST